MILELTRGKIKKKFNKEEQTLLSRRSILNYTHIKKQNKTNNNLKINKS